MSSDKFCVRCGSDKLYAKSMCLRCYQKRYHQKYKWKKKLGRPALIKEICKDFGISEHVAEAIALDGIVLETEMKKRGIL